MPVLRVHLATGRPGDYPAICILCGTDASALVERTFTVHSSLQGHVSYTTQVPACPQCARAILRETGFKWATILGCIVLSGLFITLMLSDLVWPALACLAGVVVAILAFWRYYSLYNVACVELTDRHALLKVRTAAFADAYRAHHGLGGENEAPLDMVERMLAEGFKRAKITAALESRGLSSMDAANTLSEYLRGRSRANRAVGLKRIGYGALIGTGGVAASVLAPNTIFVGAIVIGFAYFMAGVVQLLTGTGNRLS